MTLETEARWQQQEVHYLTINLSFYYRDWDKRAIEFWHRRKKITQSGIIASSTADRVTPILCLFYEAYLLKLFSHSCLLLYTEDSVVLKSESNNKPRRVVETRRGSSKDLLFLRVTTRVITTYLSTSMIYVSLIMNSVLIESRSLQLFVLNSTYSGGSFVIGL